jgi:Tol biopolymer transport system component
MTVLRKHCWLVSFAVACGGLAEFAPYFGQELPGETPVLFAPGIVSTDQRELNSIFTPDGREFYFSIADSAGATVMVTRWADGVWTEPAPASFSSGHGEVDPFISPDGNRLFYGSRRPLHSEEPEAGWQIWVVDRLASDWGEPQPLGGAVNSGERQIYPSIAADGTLYFQSIREGTLGESDIFFSRLEDGEYRQVENIGPPINSEYAEGDVYIAPAQDYVIFVSSDRPGGFGQGDLYISFRLPSDTWSMPMNLGSTINTERTDYCPVVSPDGRYFFYTSGGDVYWMEAGFIAELRKESLP